MNVAKFSKTPVFTEKLRNTASANDPGERALLTVWHFW